MRREADAKTNQLASLYTQVRETRELLERVRSVLNDAYAAGHQSGEDISCLDDELHIERNARATTSVELERERAALALAESALGRERSALAETQTQLQQERTAREAAESQLQWERMVREAAESQLHGKVTVLETAVSSLRAGEEAFQWLLPALVGSNGTATEYRDLAEERGEKLEAEERRVEGKGTSPACSLISSTLTQCLL